MVSKKLKLTIMDSIGCDVVIETKAIKYLKKYLGKNYSKVFLISDQKLKMARMEVFQYLRDNRIDYVEMPLKAGENIKNFEYYNKIIHFLASNGADKKSQLIALGGGTIGDLVGFVASTYMRGISWIGIPTTLLAQVDSALGGKTGINLETGKNLIGTIYQPKAILCQTSFLKTLGQREILSGLAEIIKYGICFDQKLFLLIKNNEKKIMDLEPKIMAEIIFESLKWKIQLVKNDIRDELGIREKLNFGHTFGHALETITGYKYFQHGEAIIWGMRFALHLSKKQGLLARSSFEEIEKFLSQLSVPRIPNGISMSAIKKLFLKDKKSTNRKMKFVLLQKMGKTKTVIMKSETDIDDSLKWILGKK